MLQISYKKTVTAFVQTVQKLWEGVSSVRQTSASNILREVIELSKFHSKGERWLSLDECMVFSEKYHEVPVFNYSIWQRHFGERHFNLVLSYYIARYSNNTAHSFLPLDSYLFSV